MARIRKRRRADGGTSYQVRWILGGGAGGAGQPEAAETFTSKARALALVFMVWGGLNTMVGNLVLAGVIRPESGFDRSGMIGHAYLWDPLFLAWGAALTIGLIASHGRAIEARRPSAERALVINREDLPAD